MLIKASGVKLLICGGTAQTVHTHLHTGMIAHNNTSVYRQVTLKINLHGCIYKEPQCSFKWNKCALLIQSSSSSSSDAQTHVNMALNCRSGGSNLCKHKDPLCTLQLTARNNCSLLISCCKWDTLTHGCTHEIDRPAARKQRDRLSPTAVDSSKL